MLAVPQAKYRSTGQLVQPVVWLVVSGGDSREN
jgi:hypothetical protein